MNIAQWNAYITAHQDRFQHELFEILRVPSVAAQNRGIEETATLVETRLARLGATVQRFPIPGASPVIYATIGNGARRLVIYDHYDVQPEDPIALWDTPPFEPTLVDDKLYARGVADNKGNLMLRIQAIETWMATQGDLPISIAFVIEGEEEIGSSHLPMFCQEHADLLRGDGCLWETGEVSIDERPYVSCGAKGIQYVELVARGARTDLHSSLATIVPNPAWRLVWALATLKAPDERILIPGFRDEIRPPSDADMQALSSMPNNDDAVLADYGIDSFLGNLRGVDLLRHHLFEPTCTICGIVSGYTDEGVKTVLPNEARAKIDFRLVPDMEPETVIQRLRQHLDAQGFADIEVQPAHGEHPARSDLNTPLVHAMTKAAETTYGVPVVLAPTMAGTGPMFLFGPALGVPVVSGAGCGYHGMQIHAPNENIRIADYWKAITWMGHFLEEFAQV